MGSAEANGRASGRLLWEDRDEVGQLTPALLSLYLTPGLCSQDPGLPGCREEGAGARGSVSTVDRCAAHVLHWLLPQQPRREEAVGRNRGAGPLNTLLVKGIEVGMGERKGQDNERTGCV